MTWRIVDGTNVTEQFCIYWTPSDKPGKFVVRRWEITASGELIPCECKEFTRLTGARKSIPKGMVRIGRDVEDDKSIVEVWI